MMTSEQRLAELVDSLTYHKPGDYQVTAIETLRNAQMAYARALIELTPAGRAQSVAITHFEESCMWAVKAIVLADSAPAKQVTGPANPHAPKP